MVDQRDGNREDFIINENYASEEVDLSREEYYERPSEAFQIKSITPFVIGGLGLGYTLRQTLDMLAPQASVTVA